MWGGPTPVVGVGPLPFFLRVVRRCPTLPHPHECCTIGAVGLSFRVWNGTGRFPHAMTTVTRSPHQSSDCLWRGGLLGVLFYGTTVFYCTRLSCWWLTTGGWANTLQEGVLLFWFQR